MPDGIHLEGAGKDRTIIRKLYKSRENLDPMFNVRCEASQPFVFSGITLQGDGVDRLLKGETGSSVLDTGLLLNGKCIDFRIYNSRFTRFAGEGIFLRGKPLYFGNGRKIPGHQRGVVYGNEFIDNYYVNGFGYGIQLAGDENDWSIDLGGENAVFIEDNLFDRNRHAIASNNASRYVFRHNKIINNWYPFTAIDAHGLSAWARGSRSVEIYGNVIAGGIEWATGNPRATWSIGLRGGDGVVFDNTFQGNSGLEILLTVEGIDSIAGSYPRPDQIRDLWIWNNSGDGKPVRKPSLGWTDGMRSKNAIYLQEGRDFHFEPKPGYQPFPYPHPLRNSGPNVPTIAAPKNLRLVI